MNSRPSHQKAGPGAAGQAGKDGGGSGRGGG